MCIRDRLYTVGRDTVDEVYGTNFSNCIVYSIDNTNISHVKTYEASDADDLCRHTYLHFDRLVKEVKKFNNTFITKYSLERLYSHGDGFSA